MLIFYRVSAASLLVSSLLFSSCQKDDTSTNTRSKDLVFDSFYNECLGERCVEIYKLESSNQKVSEDTQATYPSQNSLYDGKHTAFPATFYSLVQDLPDLIPSQLFLEGNGVIGSPDALDQGGFYLETTQNGTRRH